jgi:hypothetical protein
MQVGMRAAIASGILLASVAGASAQDQDYVCRIIAHYFVNAPKGFLDERGEQLGPGYWRSNLDYPNASCYIRVRNNRYRASCIINNHGSADAITQYGKLVEDAVDSCIARIPNGSDYDKDTETTHEDGVLSHAVTWENDADDADYEIEISGNKDDSDGHLYNAFSVTWTKK